LRKIDEIKFAIYIHMENNKYEEIDILVKDYLSANTIICSTPDNRTQVNLHVYANWVNGHSEEKEIDFIIPEGYKRYSFSSNVEKHGINSGGSVKWSKW